MAFTSRARGNPVLHTDVNQYAQYFAGTNSQAVSRVADSSSSYADTVYQRDTTNGYILRAGYGSAGAETLMLDVTKTRSIISNFADKGGQVHDVRAYGTLSPATLSTTWTGSDNSTVFQAAINAAVASGANAIYIPRGVWGLSTGLDCTDLPGGFTIIADNPSNTRLVALSGMAGKTMFDFSGSASIKMFGLGIGDTANASNPETALLFANSSTYTSASNVHYLQNVSISGSYTIASVYNCAGVSSRMVDCQIQNHYDAAVPALYFSATNTAGVTSDFTTISATGGVGEWGFFGCEIHEVAKSSGASTGYSMILDGAYGVNFYGGNIGGNGPSLVRFVGANVGVGFFGTQLYAQDPSGTAPTNTFYCASGASVTGMVVENCRVDAGTAVFGGASGTSYTRARFKSNTVNGGAASLVAFTTAGTLTDCDMECLTLAVNCGTGTITRGRYVYPGTVTANTRSDQIVQSDGAVALRGGYITLGAAVASAGAIRGVNNTSWRMNNAGNTADLVIASSDASDNLAYATSSGTIGTIGLGASAGNIGAITIGKTSGSSTVTVNSTTGVSLTYGATTRLATTSTGATATGVLNATTALSTGATPATVGAIRLTNNDSMIYRNGANSGDIIVMNMDGSNNLNFGSTSGMGTTHFRATSGISFTTTSGQIEAGTAALSTSATAGHFCIPSCAGAATGAVSPTAGMVAMIYDSTNHQIYVRSGGTWRKTAALT